MKGEIAAQSAQRNEKIKTYAAQLHDILERLGRVEELVRINEVLEAHSDRLDSLQQVSIAERLGRLEEGQARIDANLSSLSARQDASTASLSDRLSRLEQSQAHTAGVLETLPERLGRLEQARMNGVLETLRDGLFERAGRAGTGDRVAEDAESYDPQG